MKPNFSKYSNRLVPTIIEDYRTKQVLMLAYMSEESYKRSLKSNQTWFWSRSRHKLWHKGESSGHIQIIKEIKIDCDQDTLLVMVTPKGPACHTGHQSCFYRDILVKK